MSEPALTQFLTHLPDVLIMPVPLLHYDGGTDYHPFPATNTPGSDLRISGSAIGTANFFWLRTPIRPLLASLFIYWMKGTPKKKHDIPSRHSPGFPQNGIKTALATSDDEKQNVLLVSYLIIILILWTEQTYEESRSSGIPK